MSFFSIMIAVLRILVFFIGMTSVAKSSEEVPEVRLELPLSMQLKNTEGRVRLWLFSSKTLKNSGVIVPSDTEALYFRNGRLIDRDATGGTTNDTQTAGVSQPGCKVRFRTQQFFNLPAPTNTELFPNSKFIHTEKATYGVYIPDSKKAGIMTSVAPQGFYADASYDPVFSVSCLGDDPKAPVTIADYYKHLGTFFGGAEFVGPDAEKNLVASMTRQALEDHKAKLAAAKIEKDQQHSKQVAAKSDQIVSALSKAKISIQ